MNCDSDNDSQETIRSWPIDDGAAAEMQPFHESIEADVFHNAPANRTIAAPDAGAARCHPA